MSYRSLLVFLDQDPQCDARVAFALRLAKVLDCHVVGAAPTGVFTLPPAVALEAGASLVELGEVAWDTLRNQAGQVAERFREACRAAGIRSYEAVVDEDDKARSLVRFAHCSDLTVLSQIDPAAPGHLRAQEFVEEVVLQSARPTLIVPYAFRSTTVATRAMVAWDDSREAARAVWDALPLLRVAESVHIVSWREAGDADDKTLPQRLDALQRWLMWQGVSAELHIEVSEIGIAEAMLSRAADLSADLIVMGAYGHARWTERVLGGATRGLLASMTVPVLMSH